MKRRTQTVIIGAGIVGAAAAHYLAEAGHTDVVVIDRGPLPRTGGSTSHAPGGVFQNNASRTVSKLAQWTTELFREVDTWGEETVWRPVGTLEVATTEHRLADLARKFGFARSYGLNARLLGPAETGELLPLLDTSLILGAIHVEGDGIVHSVDVVDRLIARARARGVDFEAATEALAVDRSGGRVRGVETRRGRIDCEQVLVCAGIWGPLAGRLAGIEIPLQPCAHAFIRTGPIAELAGETTVRQPLWRHQDHSMYLWQWFDGYGVGTYRHEPRLIEPEQIDASGPAPSELDWDESVMAPSLREAERLVPALRGAAIRDRVLGMFSFTSDAMSLVGESVETEGLWVAEAVWVTHGGGVGRAVAGLMLEGSCELDLRELDCNRFARHAASRPFVRARGLRQYVEVYDVIHPLQPYEDPRGLRRTPFYDRQRELGAYFIASSGWERPAWYEANAELERPAGAERGGWNAEFWSPIQAAEHRATREAAGLYDMSTFHKIEIAGHDALAAVQRLAASDLDRAVGKVAYTAFLNERGGIESDLTILRRAEDAFLLLCGSGSGPRDLAWVLHHTRGLDVQVRDLTSGWCALGLWGPNASAILAPLADRDLSTQSFRPFTAQELFLDVVPVLALRLSYVGEDGFELHLPSEYGGALWERLRDAGREHGLVVCGTGAMDSLRLERGYRALGTDLVGDRTPAEAGIGFVVGKGKTGFIGADAARRPPREQLACLVLDDPSVVLLGKEPILVDGEVRGYVTSANFGYTVQRSIALGYLPVADAAEGARCAVEYFAEQHGATVTAEPLYDPAARPAAARA